MDICVQFECKLEKLFCLLHITLNVYQMFLQQIVIYNVFVESNLHLTIKACIEWHCEFHNIFL